MRLGIHCCLQYMNIHTYIYIRIYVYTDIYMKYILSFAAARKKWLVFFIFRCRSVARTHKKARGRSSDYTTRCENKPRDSRPLPRTAVNPTPPKLFVSLSYLLGVCLLRRCRCQRCRTKEIPKKFRLRKSGDSPPFMLYHVGSE